MQRVMHMARDVMCSTTTRVWLPAQPNHHHNRDFCSFYDHYCHHPSHFESSPPSPDSATFVLLYERALSVFTVNVRDLVCFLQHTSSLAIVAYALVLPAVLNRAAKTMPEALFDTFKFLICYFKFKLHRWLLTFVTSARAARSPGRWGCELLQVLSAIV